MTRRYLVNRIGFFWHVRVRRDPWGWMERVKDRL